MPDKFGIEMQKLKIRVNQCEALNDKKYRQCQAEVDNKQNELIQRLHITNRSAAFLDAKIQVIEGNANKVQNAVVGARSTFKEILEKKDSSFTDVFIDILWVMTLSVVPAAGAALNPLREWRKSLELMKRFGGELAHRSGTIVLDTQQISKAGKAESKTIDTFEFALNKAQEQLDLATIIRREFLNKIQENNIAFDFDVEGMWKSTGFGEYAEPITLGFKEFEDYLVYKSLQNYAKEKCRYFMNPGFTKSSVYNNRIHEENSGNFKGMSLATRKTIYEKFGKNWTPSPSYPRINNLSDLLKNWEVTLIEDPGNRYPIYVEQRGNRI